MKKAAATNTFQDGLLMDLNPLATPNNVLTNCLNGTLITYNGNENVLQNDMGNGRVETAFLPEGYVPLGTTEYGGIIYIVSYNPLNKQCQIGSFPSPERNITNDEACKLESTLSESDFLDYTNGLAYVIKEGEEPKEGVEIPVIKQGISKLVFKDIDFNPGDFYKIFFKDNKEQFIEEETDIRENILTDYGSTTKEYGESPKKIKIDIVAVNKDGGITSFKDHLKWYDIEGKSELPSPNDTKSYYIAQNTQNITNAVESQIPINLDNYRSKVSTPYNIFRSRSTGNLALLCELEIPNIVQSTFEITNLEKTTFTVGDITKPAKCATIKFKTKWDCRNIDYLYLKFNEVNRVEDINGTSITPKAIIVNNLKNGEYMYPIQVNSSDNSYEFSIKVTSTNNILFYEIYPATDYGIISYLVNKGNIDLSKVGSGEYDISSWQYYNSNEYITLNFFSEIYPKPQDKVNSIYLQFLPISQTDYTDYLTKPETSSIEEQWINNAETYYKEYNIPTLKIDQDNYSGTIIQNIYFKQELLYGYLIPNTFYRVNVIYKIQNSNSTTYKSFIKSIYTCPIFNIEYGHTQDFTTLNLNDYLNIRSDLIHTPIIGSVTMTEDNPEELTNDKGEKFNKQNTIFTVNSDTTVAITPYFDNNFGTFLINKYTLGSLTSKDRQTDKTKTIINTGTISEEIPEAETIKTDNVANENGAIHWKFTADYTIPILYTIKSVQHLFTNSFQPIISTVEDVNKLGLIELYKNKKYSFAPSSVMTMFYTDDAGKRAGTVVGTANLQKDKQNDENYYYTQSTEDLRYTSPGYSDNNNTYVIGRNDYKTGETALGGLEKLGFDDSFDQICSDIGTPIVVCIYASISGSDFGDDQQLTNVIVKGVSKVEKVEGGGNWFYFKQDSQGISESKGNKTAYQIYIRTDKGYYRPINIIQKTAGTNSLTTDIPDVLDNFNIIIKYFMQLYYLKNISEQQNINLVNELKYYDKYDVKVSRPIEYSVNVTDLYINGISSKEGKNLKLPSENKNLVYSSNTLKQSGSISISFNLVNEELINKKYEAQTPNVNTLIKKADGNVLQTNNLYSDTSAVYYLFNDIPFRLNDTYSQFVAYDGTIEKQDNKYILRQGKSLTLISNPLTTPSYQINNGELELKTSVLSSNTFKLTLEDSKSPHSHKGTITKMIDFEPIKFN